MFIKYQHIEKFDTQECEGIDLGRVYVFPKIDGTNASLWWEYNNEFNCGALHAGSRTRELSLDNDNAGFFNWCIQQPQATSFSSFFNEYPKYRLYGEWLVPHTLKTYKDESWNNFYVFDVLDESGETRRYVPYEEYQLLMEEFGIDYIPPVSIINNPTKDRLIHQLQSNVFLIKDGEGIGEGVVLKNYQFVNQYGRTTWAKIVTSDFKEKHVKTMGAPEITDTVLVEQKIVDKYVTQSMCDKVYAKIASTDGWTSHQIPRLLNTVYYDLIREESWNFIKKFKNPTVDFRRLNQLTIHKVKKRLPKLF